MEKTIDISDFFHWKELGPVFDVRTPAEYAKGHIPGALNLPLFSNEERALVGTIYKQQGPDEALNKGLELAGPKLPVFLQNVKEFSGSELIVHCWRGGKRSKSVAWLLNFAGYKVRTLLGGYKAYRRYILNQFAEKKLNLLVLGGRTGCGKTAILHELKMRGEQVLDLEAIAHHKGSAFGWIGEGMQPTVEQFENNLYEAVRKIDPERRVWVENESKSIGRVYIPDALWWQLKNATLLNIELPVEERVQYLISIYANEHKEDLIQSFQKIRKRLGGQNLKAAISALQRNDYLEAARIALWYYDKTYQYNLEKNISPLIFSIPFPRNDPAENARALIRFCKQKNLYELCKQKH